MTPPSSGQLLAVAQLRQMAAESLGALEIVSEPVITDRGAICTEFSLDCTRTAVASGGLSLRRRERFVLYVGGDFPFSVPTVVVPHRRWAGTPHVQWGCQLCLYASPSVEWVPADGLFGLVERLLLWLKRAALGELDPDDQPLHPPVAYTSSAHGVTVVHPDLGELAPPDGNSRHGQGARTTRADVAPSYRLAIGLTVARSDHRKDVIAWMSREEWLHRFNSGQLPPSQGGRPVGGALAVLCNGELSFEYPSRAGALVDALEELGLARSDLFDAIGEVAAVNHELASQRAQGAGTVTSFPFDLFVGTPSRGMPGIALRQHLVCWRFDDIGRLITENILFADSGHPAVARLGDLAQRLLPDWIESTETSWVQVMEARAEVTVRRDADSSTAWLHGRRVAVLGCGALGGPIAEFCVRAGVAALWVVDDDVVTPGILVRQPYSDADIGVAKAVALSERLNAIRDDGPVRPIIGRVETVLLADDTTFSNVDLVIDATANNTVASLLELRRATRRDAWPPVMSVVIGHNARRGIVTVSHRGSTGAGRHVLRRLAVAGRAHHGGRLADVASDLFPIEPRATTFQPEPGCSSPTFIGSAADLAALAGALFDAGLQALAGSPELQKEEPMLAGVVRLSGAVGPPTLGTDWFTWPNDEVVRDVASGYEVRISRPALTRMRAEVRRGARLRGPDIETGGILFGQVDDACRCIWIDDVAGPPPDSLLSAVHFDHGVEGVEDLITYHRDRSGRMTAFVGMWHSHPYAKAEPSPTDRHAMRSLVTPLEKSPIRALVVIVGGDEHTWTRWVAGVALAPDIFAQLATRGVTDEPIAAPPVPASHRATAWPGGWRSRSDAPRPRRRRRRWLRRGGTRP